MLALWNGQIPLARAFWEYAMLWGTTLNIAATAGALAGFALGLPDVLAFAVHLLPLPYVFVAVSEFTEARPATPVHLSGQGRLKWPSSSGWD